MNSSDPLSSPDTEDIFKSTFKGSIGVAKISSTAKEIETGEEKKDPLKLVADLSPDDDDLFSDCRSDYSDSRFNSTHNFMAATSPEPSAVHSPASLLPSIVPAASVQEAAANRANTTNTNNNSNSRQIDSSAARNIPRQTANGVGSSGTAPGAAVAAGGWKSETAQKQAAWSGSLQQPAPRCEEREEVEFVTVVVSDPHKVGEGISSYMAYKVSTRTNLKCFRRGSFSVIRRYSDFLGLHDKLVGRYQFRGRIIPPPPEKSIIGTTKVKMGSAEGQGPGSEGPQSKATFISLRRAALERFINRVGFHPVLRLDSDFVDFLEAGGDLPRATSTSALSSASVFKMISRVGETVNKIAYKMEETDSWFEEKTTHVEQMETQLRKLFGIVENVLTCRRELALATGNLSASLAVLASCEEAFHLSRTLEGLARVEENVESSLGEQADADSAHLLELIRDYLALISSVKEVLGERVKAFLAWQNAINTLQKKREQRSRMELGGKLDRMGAVLEDVCEWEVKVEDTQDNFNKISEVIKVEMELFQHYRVSDLKNMVVLYLEELSRTQLQMVNYWEAFLPEIKRLM